MNVRAITILVGLGLATASGAAAQSKSPGPSVSSKSRLAEVRSRVHDLEATTSKLRVSMEDYRSLTEQRPSSDDKKGNDRWNRAMARLMERVRTTHAAIVDRTQRLDEVTKEPLPTSLGKDVADARNEAEATRADAEQALKSYKPPPPSKAEPKKAPERDEPDSDPLRDL